MRGELPRSVLSIAVFSLLCMGVAAHGAQRVVNLTTDINTAGELRYEINNAGPGDEIVFSGAAASGVITLTSGQITIAQDLTISGPGARLLSITSNGRIFSINRGATVLIQDVTLADAPGTSANGGAIYMGGASNVTLERMAMTGNHANAYEGGAIYCEYDNTNGPGILTIEDSTLSGNHAAKEGAIYTVGCLVSISDSTISDNYASDSQGAALFAYSSLDLKNSTVYGNTATYVGGILAQASNSVNIVSSILANNIDGTGINDLNNIQGSTVNASNSLFSEAAVTINPAINGTNTANIVETDPQLGGLANNGGPTDTRLPGAGSPVLDTGSNPDALLYDQRGPGYPRESGLGVDMGAVEVYVPITAIPALSGAGLALLALLLVTAGLILSRRLWS